MTISPSGDVLVIEAVCPTQYPSVNNSVIGNHRGGKKTPGYHDLFDAVLAEAKAAVDAGWKMVEFPCRATIDRFAPNLRVFDAVNLAQTEWNALTRGGVWADDTLAQDCALRYHPGCEGADRIVIVITRLPAPASAAPRAPRPLTRKQKAATTTPQESLITHHRSPSPTAPMALLDGKPIPMEEAMRLIGREK